MQPSVHPISAAAAANSAGHADRVASAVAISGVVSVNIHIFF